MSSPSPIEAGGNSSPSTFSEEKQVGILQTNPVAGSHVICSVSKGIEGSWGREKCLSRSLSCFCERSEIRDVSHLGDRLFFDFACRSSRKGAPSAYALRVMSGYLEKKGYQVFADDLGSAYHLLRTAPNEIENESKRIHDGLYQGVSQLFEYGYNQHSMGLNLVPDPASGFVICEIFNSGDGLSKYHEKHETDFRKFKTMLQIRVPMGSLTPDTIRVFLSSSNFNNVDEPYRAILDLLGAEILPSDSIPWQTKQKDSECTFRWILAYLKNKIPNEEYKQLLAELRFDCEAAYRNEHSDEASEKDSSWLMYKRTFPNGDVYEGDFVYGTFHGKGKYTFADGTVYEGAFSCGKFHGKGNQLLSNGDSYEGDFFNDEFHGKGKYTFENGVVYQGDFVYGRFHGKGNQVLSNGDSYEGGFSNHEFHGKGKYTSLENGTVYEGDFVNGKFHGKGKLTLLDGTICEGDFFEGNFQPSGNQRL